MLAIRCVMRLRFISCSQVDGNQRPVRPGVRHVTKKGGLVRQNESIRLSSGETGERGEQGASAPQRLSTGKFLVTNREK